MARTPVAVLLGGLLLSGCQGAASAAKDKFALEYSCPEDRVTVRPRDDIRWSTVALHVPESSPPPEVQKDPARYAKWKADQAEQYAPLRELYDSFDVFEGTGCDHDVLLGCKRPAKSNGPNRVICEIRAVAEDEVSDRA